MNILGAGTRCCQRLCGHIVFRVTDPSRRHHTIWSMVKTLCCHGRSRPDRGVLSSRMICRLRSMLRLWSLEKLKENKAKVARAYNKKVKPKDFQVRDLVWEAVLPLGTKDKKFGKWSPTWHGPYKVDQVLSENAYMLEELDGVKFPVAVNGQHLKKYFPSMWKDE